MRLGNPGDTAAAMRELATMLEDGRVTLLSFENHTTANHHFVALRFHIKASDVVIKSSTKENSNGHQT